MVIFRLLSERGVEYEFRISARNAVDYGEQAVETVRTPDGSKWQPGLPDLLLP